MNQIAQELLRERSEGVSEIHTVAQAEERKKLVRKRLLEDLGGLPDRKEALNAKVTGELHTDSYTIEKVIYESLPGFYVTANIYRPNRPGRYPAVLLQSGHTQEGKPENQRMAANLAMKGFVVLCFDPIGQGEREQTYSRDLDAPLAGWSVPEHIQMGAQAQLINEGLARYFIWDAMRSLDYLESRPDVEASRMGAAGCSGGGALTTFLGGLDPRLKVVIPACYPTSFKVLFPTDGPDAEMVIPHFLASGLDTADFVELSAPTPWLIETTEKDEYHFAREGVRMVYDEARRWYAFYGVEDKIGMLEGPGSHGMPLVSREAVYKWMIRFLNDGEGDFHEQPVKMFTNSELQVTSSGNVEDEPNSRRLHQLLLADFREKKKQGTVQELSSELAKLEIPTGHGAPAMRVVSESTLPDGRRQQIEFESDPGIRLSGTLYLPAASGRKPAVLMVKGSNLFGLTPMPEIAEKMMKLGRVVLEMEPRKSGLSGEERPFTGQWVTNLQANLIGKNLPALRAHDILRGVDLLAARSDVDSQSIRGAARGVPGIWLLLAAASDSRISKIWLDRTPASLREALERRLTDGLWDAVMPGFILRWNLDDLRKVMGERKVLWTDPTNWMQRVVPLSGLYEYRYVLGDSTDLAAAQDDNYIHQLLQ